MRWIALTMLAIGAMASIAAAQTVGCNVQNQKWNYDVIEIYWEYVEVVNPPADGIRLFVGTKPGEYTITRDLGPKQFSFPIRALIPGPGRYYANIAPLYAGVQGGLGDECFFESARAKIALGVRPIP